MAGVIKREFVPAGLALLVVVGVYTAIACVSADPPQPGWSTGCKIVEVYDGDTITVEITRRVRVRLIDCWADEIRTKDPAEKERGLLARDALREIAEGKQAILFVPANATEKSGDEWSMGRVLGHVWVDGRSLASVQVESGRASSTKHGELGE